MYSSDLFETSRNENVTKDARSSFSQLSLRYDYEPSGSLIQQLHCHCSSSFVELILLKLMRLSEIISAQSEALDCCIKSCRRSNATSLPVYPTFWMYLLRIRIIKLRLRWLEEAIDEHCMSELAEGNFPYFIVYDRVTPIVTSPLTIRSYNIFFALHLAIRWILERSRRGIYHLRGDSGRYFICDVRSFTTINHSLPWIFRESFIRFVFQPCMLYHKQ